ncbi:MAG TPA: DoxX family membrane protein [Povalibacter sp.]|nr:DoxX family membrane protein [Povalibacter sp.]
MNASTRLGRFLIGAAMTALGIQSLWLVIYVGRLQPIPDWVPGHAAIACVTGAFLLAVGLCILTGKWARLAATALAAMLLLWVLVIHIPNFIAAPGVGAALGPFETVAVFAGAWILAALLPITGARHGWDDIVDRGRVAGRLCFGVSLLVFGLAHFIYPDFVASWVPTWIPLPGLFWAWFTGAAHAAAGVAVLANVKARLAATLAAIMYGSWVLIVHIPRVHAALHDAFEWNGVFVASALCGCALLVAGSLAADQRTARTAQSEVGNAVPDSRSR